MTDIKEARTLTLEGALKVLNAAIGEATRISQPMCIAVVDTGGNLLAFGRMDGSKGVSVTSSINKARTSALSGSPTGGAHADVEIQVTLAHENRWTNLIGGLPIRADGFISGPWRRAPGLARRISLSPGPVRPRSREPTCTSILSRWARKIPGRSAVRRLGRGSEASGRFAHGGQPGAKRRRSASACACSNLSF
ncbi:heme-binding protein [Bradyrhizobium sp. Arg816]|uniref:GlcG/HbpS family heme-binding protein n=1 Tax=Bradyrhizobium sp. Arg816 TaxID=2998491 RepID=UPI00249E0997|nr:heme-binding protein [Bradyrhizobium sp. Arg816]MDI3564623.1 heme-binding protein [Bradyrhizobium sp. Arg816]